ncbi:MAG TPA: translation initiation factor IF-2, partial [Dongiaceae bacterium]|nr:translation initiation factor IF-2 [Dongiaceae bacterium]
MSSDTDTPTRKPLKLSSPGKLELKKTVDGGQVRQSFPHGRTKTVAVEVKKKRTYAPGAGGKMEVAAEGGAASHAAPPVVTTETTVAAPFDVDHHNLTPHERQARMKALEQAKRDEEVRKVQEAEEAVRAAERAERERAEAERRRKEDEERQVDAKKRAEDKIKTDTVAPATAKPAGGSSEAPKPAVARPVRSATTAQPDGDTRMHLSKALPRNAATAEDDDAPRRRTAGAPGAARPVAPKPATPSRRDDNRRPGKLTVTKALDEDAGDRVRSMAAMRRAREKEKRHMQMNQAQQQKIVREVILPETITVQELANRMAERGADVIKALMRMGVMATINQTIDADTAELIIGEFGHNFRRVSAADVEIGIMGGEDHDDHLESRPPVVTIMGHVDHGKTSLLDALRQTDVAAHEAGGITQHIGAYQVHLEGGKKITFIDTPGHAAFSEMRARGANVTDIVVLVVAADDGIMQQTIEAIHHAKAAKVPIIVAINKMDKQGANPQRVRQELLNHELVTEELGGDILTVEVSAKQKLNLDKLEEALLLQAEILDLKANPDRPAQGAVVEARLERGRGTVATLLVQKGTLKVGDIFVAGTEWGRVRALLDDRGRPVESAGPAVPVEVLGLQGTPLAGDNFVVVESEARAREITEFRQHSQRQKAAAAAGRGTLEQMFSKIQAGEAKELP